MCPSRYCNAHDPVQRLVTKRQADQVNEPALDGAILCAACGCVWVRDEASRPHILGTLRWTGAAYKWNSPYKAKPAEATN